MGTARPRRRRSSPSLTGEHGESLDLDHVIARAKREEEIPLTDDGKGWRGADLCRSEAGGVEKRRSASFRGGTEWREGGSGG